MGTERYHFFLYLLKRSHAFSPMTYNVTNYTSQFCNVKSTFQSWGKPNLITMYPTVIHAWVCFANTHLRVFASMFMSEVELSFPCLMLFFSWFGHSEYLMSELGNVLFFIPFFGRVCKKWKHPLLECERIHL